MRLPSDAALIVVKPREADPATAPMVAALLAVWGEEGLPVFHVDSSVPSALLETELEAIGATTLVLCGGPPPDAVAAAARGFAGSGYRVFVVADASGAPAADAVAGDVRVVTCETALAAARRARARERWRAARMDVAGGR